MKDYKKLKVVGRVVALVIGVLGTVIGTGIEVYATVKEGELVGNVVPIANAIEDVMSRE